MKIISLRFQNINSLAGTWEINFQDPVYRQKPLFAITGPTGAGKTSILDAICYALYGKTPRQPGITAQSNEIITRNRGECFAEITFETQCGRFRAYNYHNKANKKPDGNLQTPRRELVDDNTGKIIAHGSSDVDEKIPRLIGLNFEQFTKAIMLAQGSFGAFLNSKPDARADILEKLSGTEIYSAISQKVQERQSLEKTRLDTLLNELDAMHCMPPEERESVEKKITELSAIIEKISTEAGINRQKLDWRKKLDDAMTEMNKIQKDIAINEREITEFEPMREKIIQAQKAHAMRDAHDIVIKCRKDLKDAKETLENHRKALGGLIPEIKICEEKLKTALAEAQTAAQKKVDSAPAVKDMRERDNVIAEKQIAHEKQIKKLKNDRTDLQKCVEQLKKYQQSACGIREKIEINRIEIDKNENDSVLIENYSGIAANLRQIGKQSDERAEIQKKIDTGIKDLEAKQKKLTKTHEDEKKAAENLDESRKIIEKLRKERENILNGRTREEIEDKRNETQNALDGIVRYDKFKAERAQLKEGSPCPLCGAVHHPGISIEDIDAEIKNLSAEIENYGILLKTDDRFEKDILQAAENCRQREVALIAAKLSSEKDAADVRIKEELLDDIRSRLTLADTALNALKIEIQKNLDIYGIDLSKSAPGDLLDDLKKRCDHYKKLQNDRDTLSAEIHKIMTLHAAAEAEKTTREAQIEECENLVRESENLLLALKAERTKCYGKTNPDILEKQLDDDERNKNKALKLQQDAFDALNIRKKTLETKRDTEIQHVEKLTAERENAENAFLEKCRNNGFESEKALEEAIISQQDLKQHEIRLKQLDNRRSELIVKRSQNDEICQKLTAQNLTDETLEVLTEKQNALETRKTEQSEELGKNKEKCAQDDIFLKNAASKRLEVNQQSAVLTRWNKLYALIGSKDGKKYRQYVQGLTFSHLITLANGYLSKFNNRFILIRRADEEIYEAHHDTKPKAQKAANPADAGLSFAIIDTNQDNKMRAVSNLSGGESFQVSLALALGLSEMASRNIQIDTLFLDEGFGTLDADTLSKVLSELSLMMIESNKTVGIISHVEALKETVPTQIRVVKEAGGYSSIQGPGCRHFSADDIKSFTENYDAVTKNAPKKTSGKRGRPPKVKKTED